MRRVVFLVCVVALVTLPTRAATVPVLADVTLNQANPDSNLNSITTRGGLLSGLDNTGSDYTFLLKFDLSALSAASISSATLVGTHTDDFGPVESFHQVYFVPDDTWSETGVTW